MSEHKLTEVTKGFHNTERSLLRVLLLNSAFVCAFASLAELLKGEMGRSLLCVRFQLLWLGYFIPVRFDPFERALRIEKRRNSRLNS
jgi:hypothetical protein